MKPNMDTHINNRKKLSNYGRKATGGCVPLVAFEML